MIYEKKIWNKYYEMYSSSKIMSLIFDDISSATYPLIHYLH